MERARPFSTHVSLGLDCWNWVSARAALEAYESEVRPITTGVCQANRSGKGPDGVLQRVEDLCGGDFEVIDDVIPTEELAAHAEKYKSLAGVLDR